MTLHVIYSNATGSTQDLTTLDTIRLPGLSVTTNAEEGSVAISNLVVDDIGATLDLVGLRRVYIWESAEDALNQMIWTGFLGAREISRGPGQLPDDDTFVLSTDRRWSCELVDVNSLFSRRIITGADGNRPAETDVQRIAWLISTNYVFTVGTGNSAGYFNQSGGVAMDAADLRGQTGFDTMNDCAQRSGKLWFMFYDEGTDTAPSTYIGNMSLFYDYAYSTTYSSTLRLTNVNADVDDLVTFAVLPDAILRRSPERVYSGVWLPYDGGTVYAQRTATGDEFAYRDTAAPNSNIKTVAKAEALADRYLDDASSEDDRITCRFIVPKEKVNHLKEGQRVQVKFSHLPGLAAAYVYARCLRRTVTQRSDESYEIEVELSPTVSGDSLIVLVGHLRGTDINLSPPNQTGGGTAITWTGVFAGAATGPAGAPLDLIASGGSGGRTQIWYATVPAGTTVLQWAGAQVSTTVFFAFEIAGIGAPTASNWHKDESPVGSGTSGLIAPTGTVLLLGGVMQGQLLEPPTPNVITPSAGWSEDYEINAASGLAPRMEVSHQIVVSASGNYAYTPTFTPFNQMNMTYIVAFPLTSGSVISVVQTKARGGDGPPGVPYTTLTFDAATS